MRIGIDIRPLTGQTAGIGAYVAGLLEGLMALPDDHQYVLFGRENIDEGNWDSRFVVKVVPPTPFWHLKVANQIWSEKMFFHATHSFIDAFLLKKRCVLTVHDLTALTNPNQHTQKVKITSRLFFHQAVMRVGRIITPTQVIKDELVAKYPVLDSKTVVIHEALEADFGKLATKKHLDTLGLAPGYILFNATIEPRKNLPRLINAYSRLQNPPPLVLAGKKGWGIHEVEKQIVDLDLKDKVRILDWVSIDYLQTLYRFAVLLVYPSLSEGFGLSPLKALQMGVPVLVSDLPVFEEVLGTAALKVDPLDEENIAQGLQKSLYDQKLRSELINRGFEKVASYSWKKAAKETLAQYTKLNENF